MTPELSLQRYMAQQIMDFARVSPWPFPRPPHGTPNGTGGYISPTWADWTVLPALNVVNDARYSGDLTVSSAYLQDIVDFHLYLDKIDDDTGLVEDTDCNMSQPQRCLSALIDTSGGSDDGFVPSPVNAVVNAWVYHGMVEVAQLARWLGAWDTVSRLDTIAAKLKSSFNSLLVSGTGAVCDGLCNVISHTSVHSSFYALAFGLVEPKMANATWRYVKHRVDTDPNGLPCGSYPVQFLLRALYSVESDAGRAALSVLTSTARHSWLAMMLAHNATTTMECWDPEELPNLTFSHIWSASPAFIIPSLLAGITPCSPGFETVCIKPQPGSLTFLNVTVPTVRGPVSVSLTQSFGDDDNNLVHFRVSVVVPGNTQALLHAPRSERDCMYLDGNTVPPVEAGQTHAVLRVHAGLHTVEWC
mmetsp:Transcript_16065/g.34898  ORF Transcript_16065/g.34898 Transcript_16065/m.34898 type:complete len:416 (+) Transcript_16065:205-1452(+)